jgi:hypothetical protein
MRSKILVALAACGAVAIGSLALARAGVLTGGAATEATSSGKSIAPETANQVAAAKGPRKPSLKGGKAKKGMRF